MMFLGYNTNGFAHHDPAAAIEVLAELGYRGVALTLDHGLLDPWSRSLESQVEEMRHLLARYRLRSVIETGARFLLDPRAKHEPTLVTADPALRGRRVEFLRRAIEVATALGSDCVSLWAGVVRDDADEATVWQRLTSGLGEVLAHAERRGVVIGFEPEPGMFVDTMARFDQLRQRVASPALKLTLDVGHLHCLGETPIASVIARYGADIVNVHIEDMRVGVHEHLQFGDGEMDFPPIIDAFRKVGYEGGLFVELSRHSHEAPAAARRASDFLRPLLGERRDSKFP